jgi:hypothetical protein
MKKGESYISFTINDKPNHPIVKELIKQNTDIDKDGLIIYASMYATDAGWSLDGVFIGFTIKASIQAIKNDWFNKIYVPNKNYNP